jgi:protein scribble
LLITVVAATSACGYCSRFLFHVRWRHQTPFVRQNTPHPRELKAKAHKLFSKGQNSLEDSDLHSESVVEAVNPTVQRPQTPPPPPPTLAIPEVTEQVIGNGAEDNSEPSAEEETIDELVPKRVGFSGGIPAADDVDPVARPSRLHRRDTPHHLKNKRITATVDKDKVASIIAKVSLSFFFVFVLFC